MSDQCVPELTILDADGNSIFSRGDRYEIPLYQRPYAWGEQHIEQLIEDVRDLADGGAQKYYLGSLVVWRKSDGAYEVIDGQQRLTTLYLLLAALGAELGGDGERLALSFSCRDKSDYTLKNLARLRESEELEERRLETGIMGGMRVVQQRIDALGEEGRSVLREKLTRTRLFRIEVPEHTDLNHYFEIMNTRGEQLEQHEVLKAKMMEPLTGADAARFAAIWDACSDMSCYVQTKFGVKQREKLFGWWYGEFPEKWRIDSVEWSEGSQAESLGIRDILSKTAAPDRWRIEETEEPVRFESIIEFRFFLLHVLKVLVETQGVVADDPNEDIVPSLLDDKRLSATFERVVNKGRRNGKPIDEAWFSTAFCECLLQTRYLFDKCILKREYRGDSQEGAWSLKETCRSKKGSCYYRETRFKRRWRERATTSAYTNREALMLEACLRVSYTSPKVMHWITRLLTELMKRPDLAWSHEFVDKIRECAKDAVRGYMAAGEYSLGVNTPHVVLNYLDYLLWLRGGRKDDFDFEFRTSVEHWYPQNPSDDTFKRWDEVDCLGNLCLVQRTTNSKFSNLNPVAKQSTFQEMIAKGSLKLREMARLTKGVDDWKSGACQRHEEEMLGLLREACGD